jgi:hypothetical protein
MEFNSGFKGLKLSQVQKHNTLTIYNTLTFPTLLYGSETWAIGEPDKCRMTSAEIKFVKRTAKYRRQDGEADEDI